MWLPHGQLANTYWEDLTPFAQGYIQALSESLGRQVFRDTDEHYSFAGFSDLSPEALGMILADCEVAASLLGRNHLAADGEWFWNSGKRQPGFPPLTPTLSEDGKVNLVVQAQVGDA